MDMRLGVSCVFLMMSAYFGYHAFYGSRGCVAWKKQQERFLYKEKHLKALKEKQNMLARKVGLLSKQVDPDLLERLAWEMLMRLPSDQCVMICCPE